MKDPIAEEIHQIRAQMAKDCGYDMHRLFKMQEAEHEKWQRRRLPGGTRAAPMEVREADGGYRVPEVKRG